MILDNELHAETSADWIPKVAEARNIDLASISDRLFIDNLRGRLLDIDSLKTYFESVRRGYFKLVVLDACSAHYQRDFTGRQTGQRVQAEGEGPITDFGGCWIDTSVEFWC